MMSIRVKSMCFIQPRFSSLYMGVLLCLLCYFCSFCRCNVGIIVCFSVLVIILPAVCIRKICDFPHCRAFALPKSEETICFLQAGHIVFSDFTLLIAYAHYITSPKLLQCGVFKNYMKIFLICIRFDGVVGLFQGKIRVIVRISCF